MRRHFAWRPLLLAVPLVAGAFVAPGRLPPALAYAVGDGRWLFVIGLAAALVSLGLRARGTVPHIPPTLDDRLRSVPDRPFWTGLFVAGVLAFWAVVPGVRWSGAALGGDEHKYLRLAESLARDLDVDVSGNRPEPVSLETFADNVRRLAGSTAAALGEVVHPTPVTEDHVWSLGNWTIAPPRGGRYYVQSPGLPLVLWPGLAAQQVFLPGMAAPWLPLLTLALLWATSLVQTCRLCAETSGSRVAGLVAGAVAVSTAPLLVGGYNFYPETVAAALVPWLLRSARPGSPLPGSGRATLLALAAGFLPWLHPKFTLLALCLTLSLAAVWDLRRRTLLLWAGVPITALLLFDYAVTGLFGVDAVYRRYADSVYPGLAVFFSSRIPIGLVNGLFGARDGLLVMAPVLVGGVFALPVFLRSQPRWAATLGAVFASLWLAAAAHEGGAPGPPGRLLAPVACIAAVALAVGLHALRSSLAYRWSVGGLALVSAAIVTAMFGHWRREVDPYRGMFTPETNFSRDLPDGPRDPVPVDRAVKSQRDVLRGIVLAAILAFWSSRFRRQEQEPDAAGAWRSMRNVHAAAWVTVAAGGFVLHALGP